MEHSPFFPKGRPAAAYWPLRCRKAADALSALIDASLRDIRSRSVLQLASDSSQSVYFQLEGWLVISKMNMNGNRQIVDFLLPGDVFDPASASPILSSTDVSAQTEGRVAVIPRDDWRRFLASHPEGQLILNRRSAASYAAMAERLLRLGNGKAETRIAYAICELGLRANDIGLAAGADFHLPLTQQDLGDFVGLSSVHVSRTIGRLVGQGVLSYGGHMDIVIHDMDALAEIAEIDPHDLRAEIIIAA